MDPTSECRQSSSDPQGGPGGGADRISALPDDLLLLILARLRCVAAAVRTSVLSRRWSDGLWTRLREVAFRDVAFDSIEPALARVSPPVSVLEIHVPKPLVGDNAEAFEDSPFQSLSSLLSAAARLAPENFVLALPSDLMIIPVFVDLPCFHRATSIVLDLKSDTFALMLPAGVELPLLDTLFLSGFIAGVKTLLSGCPRLRVLGLKVVNQIWIQNDQELTVHSASLQELIVDTQKTWTSRVDIVAPSLKQLIVSLGSDKELSISILAPMLEKVLWHCYFSWGAIRFGIWCLDRLSLNTAERQGELPSLHIHACSTNFRDFFHEGLNFRQEIEKHLVAEFSVLELDLRANGHVFGSFVLHLLGMNRIRSATRRLKVVIPRSMEKEACGPNCLCVPTDWRTQIMSFGALEEVEIHGFQGEEHEFNFLRLICKCAPMLKRVIVKLSHEVSSSNDRCTKICNLFRAHLRVECIVYLSSGLGAVGEDA